MLNIFLEKGIYNFILFSKYLNSELTALNLFFFTEILRKAYDIPRNFPIIRAHVEVHVVSSNRIFNRLISFYLRTKKN